MHFSIGKYDSWSCIDYSWKRYQNIINALLNEINLVCCQHDTFEKDIYIREEWNLSNETLENMTQKEHAIRVCFKFWQNAPLYPLREKFSHLQILSFFLLHDIGKNMAKRLTADKKNQHFYTDLLMTSVWKSWKKTSWIPLSRALLFGDPLGSFLKGQTSLKATYEHIYDFSKKSQYSLAQFFHILELYYTCDAGSYLRLYRQIFESKKPGHIQLSKKHQRYKDYLSLKELCLHSSSVVFER